MALRFGLGFPTCREVQTYPVPIVRPRDLASAAQRAEQLGYYSLWGNEHLTTPRLIRATLAQPANFYEPIVTFATLASVTQRLRFMFSVVVLPQRDPVLLAKQIATLDVLSEGRVMLGLGIGGYRDELEAVRPDLREAPRGAVLNESLQALRLLFEHSPASFDGKYVRFAEVDQAPQTAQRPFPLLLSAREPAGIRRVARLADGWVAAAESAAAIVAGRQLLDAALREQGRDPATFETHFQTWLSFGPDRASAEAKLIRSQHFQRTLLHQPNPDPSAVVAHFAAGNLLGPPEDVIEQIRAFDRAGVSHLGIVMIADTMDDLLADMELFAERVMPAFAP
jgi:probable F420-dependent oxidoreductase